jgi:hypothetical protein
MEIDHQEDQDVGGGIKIGLGGTGLGGVDSIGLVRDGYRWRALVNAIINFRVP